jgi:adenylate kinase
MNLVIFGPPGAGKGTQSAKLVKEFNLFQLSTGDLLRDEVSKKTEFGNKIEEIMKSGGLVSDEIINNLIENKISNPEYKNRIIFDGFPRNIEQAKSLDNLLKKYNQQMSLALNLKVDNQILVKRITGRVTCSACNKTFNTFFDPPKNCDLKECGQRKLITRSDDNEETIVKRLNRMNLRGKYPQPLRTQPIFLGTMRFQSNPKPIWLSFELREDYPML